MTGVLDGLLDRLNMRLNTCEPRPMRGRILGIRGTLIHASIANVGIGELCRLRDPASRRALRAQVVGFDGTEVILAPIGVVEGLSTRTEIVATGHLGGVLVGDALLGRVISASGAFLDAKPPVLAGLQRYSLQAEPPGPFDRELITEPLPLGVRCIDALLTVARGQRVGVFGEPGVGKTSLLAAVVNHCSADVIVIGLIGERGREVRELLDIQLSAKARARTVAVVATSDQPASERVNAALVATAQAEYHRDQGRSVLLLLDSLTRFARAQREIGLAIGEPPTRRGYPPSFFSALPRLLERTGPARRGSITALYTVLTEGDPALDPVAEEARSILDGHIVLSAELAQRNHFPAIDVLRSRSRMMDKVVSAEHREWAAKFRQLLARYDDIELLMRTGDYVPGSDALADEAIARRTATEHFLRQPADESSNYESSLHQLSSVLA